MRIRYFIYFIILLFLLVLTDKISSYIRQKNIMFPTEKLLSATDPSPAEKMNVEIFKKLLPLHKTKKAPGPYDWLTHHPEPGQTFEQYLMSDPTIPDDHHKTIYMVLLGDFDEKRNEIIHKTAAFISAYYQMPVRFLKPLPLSMIPNEARRIHPQTGDKQILTRFVIDNILVDSKPQDAFCLIAFSSADLWPGEGWNFVFGEASLYDRVGVWSIYRNGDPNAGNESYDLCLMRTIKTGVHEIGHMFSFLHCIYFECVMNGSNHRKESDERPLWLCPVCLRKLSWALNMDKENVIKRYEDILQLFEKYNFRVDKEYYRKALNMF